MTTTNTPEQGSHGTTANPYLAGNFAPVRQEKTLTELEVTGTIPEHLDGRYVRNGPNPVAELDPRTYHWLMGDGMVHGVRLREGRAEWYRNRWVRGPRAARALGEPHRQTRLRAGIEAIGANTNVITHGGRTIALIEGGNACHELTEELDTIGSWDVGDTLSGGYTAHPKRDPDTGELHAVSYHFGRGNTVQYSVIDRDGRARRAVDITVGGSPMMHDFALTQNHVVFLDLPVTFNPRAAAAMMPRPLRMPARLMLSAIIGRIRIPDPITALAGRGLPANGDFPYRWNPRYPARLGVMPRQGGNTDVRWFDIEPCYVFHTLNAYDDNNSIVLDVVRHPKMFDINTHGPHDKGPPTLERWTVNLTTGAIGQQRLDDHSQEFPRIDERRVGKPHRYGYSLSLREQQVQHSVALLKHDLDTNKTITRKFGANREPGEFIFEPNTTSSSEDDGVLMGFVHDRSTDRSDLMLLDATTLDTIATVHLPVRVPHGIHGNWLPTH